MSNRCYFVLEEDKYNQVWYGDPSDLGAWRVLVATCYDVQHADYIASALNLIPNSFDNPQP